MFYLTFIAYLKHEMNMKSSFFSFSFFLISSFSPQSFRVSSIQQPLPDREVNFSSIYDPAKKQIKHTLIIKFFSFQDTRSMTGEKVWGLISTKFASYESTKALCIEIFRNKQKYGMRRKNKKLYLSARSFSVFPFLNN